MRTNISIIIKKNILFLILIPIVIISQTIILKPHLQYGLTDEDWRSLTTYQLNKSWTIPGFITNITTDTVYAHQTYYLGILESIFGFNFENFHKVTHIFRNLVIILSYPLFLIVAGSSLIAFISAIILGFSLSAVGTLFQIGASSEYLAIFSMEIFFLIYWHIITREKQSLFWLLSALMMLILTLFLSTQRMYPILLFIVLIESYLLIKRKPKKITLKRILVILLPVFLIGITRLPFFLISFSGSFKDLTKGILDGNWNLILTPFISLGSMIIPQYNGVLSGQPIKFNDFFSFLNYFIFSSRLIPLLFFSTILIGVAIFKKPSIFITRSIALTTIFLVILYFLSNYFTYHLITMGSVVQALIGFYILAIAFSGYKSWKFEKDRVLIGIFIGPLWSILYLFVTWLNANPLNLFVGAHRYLTIPALGTSLFIGTLTIVSIQKLLHDFKKIKLLRILSAVPLILLFIFIKYNIENINNFFSYQLQSGFGLSDQQYMKSQLNNQLSNLSSSKPSFFYFDFSEDYLNGYYYDNTIHASFPSWMLWNEKIYMKPELSPCYLWNQPDVLAKSETIKQGKVGLLCREEFFELENFYAFELKDKRVFDIKDKILKKLGIISQTNVTP